MRNDFGGWKKCTIFECMSYGDINDGHGYGRTVMQLCN